MKHPLRRSWLYQKLISVRFLTWLLLILAGAMLAGTMLPQGREPGEYLKSWGLTKYVWLASFDLLNVFQSWWFLALAALFGLVLLLCSTERFLIWLTLRGKRIPIYQYRLSVMKVTREELLADNVQQIVGKLAEYCGQQGFKLEAGQKNNTWVMTKGLNSTVISVLYHLGLVFCLLGFALSYLGNYEGEIYLAPGESQVVMLKQASRWGGLKDYLGFSAKTLAANQENSLTLRLLDFQSEYQYQDGKYWPKDWFSTLEVLQGPAVRKVQRIEVNAPLRYRGLVFYQAGYELAATLEIVVAEGDIRKIEVEPYQDFTVPGILGQFRVKDVRRGLVFEGDRPPVKVVPEVELTFSPPAKITSAAPVKLKPLAWQQVLTIQGQLVRFSALAEKSGLNYRYDPGVYLLWPAGFLLVLLMGLRVYLPAYRLLLLLDPVNFERTHVKVGLESKGLFAQEQVLRDLLVFLASQ